MNLLHFPFIFLIIIFSSFDSIHGEETQKKNKFREREASDDMLAYPNLDEDSLLDTKCPRHLELRWQTEVSSSIYATPLIADVNSDGKLEVVVPSFVHYLEVLEGSDGDKVPGWPAFHQSTVHSSPILFDIDKDGTREIALANYNGVINFFRVSGYMMVDKLEVPRRRVRKNWYVGLYPDPVDRSHPDVHDYSLGRGSSDTRSVFDKDVNGSAAAHSTGSLLNTSTSTPGAIATSVNTSSTETTGRTGSSLNMSSISTPVTTNSSENTTSTSTVGRSGSAINETTLGGTDFSINASKPENATKNESTQATLDNGLPNSLANVTSVDLVSGSVRTENAAHSQRRLLQENESKESQEGNSNSHAKDETEKLAAGAENKEGLEEEADASFDLFRDTEDLADEYNYDYDDYVDPSMWGDEDWMEEKHEKLEDYVNIDSHILCTPVIADIDGDGVQEMVVAVSYFFDREYYDNPEHMAELGGINIEKYVATGIVVFNLDTKQVKWTADLDLSSDNGTFRAYIYSSPTVIDLDGDGNLDILVGTSFGLVYVLNHHGKVREKFPLEMAEIQGPVVAADINDDGKIEIVTTDSHGNVAAWTAHGVELWEVHLKSLIPGATIGDVDGDGHTDVVIPTISGNIYVLSGKDGSFVRPFPYRTHGRVMSPVLLVDLSKPDEKSKGLTLVTSAFDGYLYLIDGSTACADVVDIGETSYSMVLADNVDGGDDLDLIVTTMNGNVFCFSTPSPHHPLKEWRSSNQGRNNAASRYNRQGIYISHESRAFRDEEGKHFWVEMEIVDKYRAPRYQGPYNVTTSLLVPGNYQGERRIVANNVYHEPGKQRIKLQTVPVRTTGTVVVEMVDKNGLYFSDEFSLTFHMHYYKLLKWLLILPMLGMFGVLVILRPQEGTPLPSFSRNTD